MKLFFAALCGIVLLFCGCRSDLYYQERAVERARTYLLKNARDLTPEQLAYVRVNDPVLLYGNVLASSSSFETSGDLYQICITWVIPGKKELYMVYGASSGRMDYWYPVRIVKRYYFQQGIPWQAAVQEAEKYATDNLYESLTPMEMNQIRFANPWLMETTFALNLETLESTDSANVSKKKPEKEPKKKKQYSLVWKFPKKNLVFSGFNPPWKGGWSILFATFVSDAELKQSTVKVIASPDDLQSVVIKEDEEETAGKVQKNAPESKKEEK